MSESNFSEVLNDYARTAIQIKAKQISRRSGFSSTDIEDIEQQLTIELLRRAKNFDPQKSTLKTFIAQLVNHAVATLLRHRSRSKRSGDFRAESLDVPCVSKGHFYATKSQAMSTTDRMRRIGVAAPTEIQRVDQNDSLQHALATLPAELRPVCARLSTASVQAIALELGLTRHQVHRFIQQVRQHFAASGFSNLQKSRTDRAETA